MNNQFSRLTTLVQQLQNELEGVLSTNDDIAKREKLQDDKERDLGVRMNAIAQKEQLFVEKEAEYHRNKEYLDRENMRLSKLGHQLEYDKQQVADVDEKILELEAKNEETRKHEIALGERIKAMEGLVEKEKELAEREAKVNKDIAIDRERKRLLDLREDRIRAREQQLQLDSEKTDL